MNPMHIPRSAPQPLNRDGSPFRCSAPFDKKAVSGEDFHNKVLEALGDIVEAPSEATESVAEALQQSAEETINLELAAATAALDDAVSKIISTI